MADNLLRVQPIRNGTVIAHIKPGRGKKILDVLDGQQFFLSRLRNNEVNADNLRGLFGVCVNLINKNLSSNGLTSSIRLAYDSATPSIYKTP